MFEISRETGGDGFFSRQKFWAQRGQLEKQLIVLPPFVLHLISLLSRRGWGNLISNISFLWDKKKEQNELKRGKLGKAQAAMREEAAARCLWFLCDLRLKISITWLSRIHKHMHRMGGEEKEKRQTQRGSLGAQVHKGTKEKGERSLEEQRKNIKKEGGTAVSRVPQHVTADTERCEETSQNIRHGCTEAQSIPSVIKNTQEAFKPVLTRRVWSLSLVRCWERVWYGVRRLRPERLHVGDEQPLRRESVPLCRPIQKDDGLRTHLN